MKPFKPFFGLKNHHLQTLVSYVIFREKPPESETQFIALPDGDSLAIEVSTPQNWQPDMPTILMVHGIGGSHNSPYLVRLTHKLTKLSLRVVRLNFRGVGSGIGKAKSISHGGSSYDLLQVILKLKEDQPHSPLIVVGFSLSGNIALKLAGEQDLSPWVSQLMAICPAINLDDSSKRLDQWQNTIYRSSILSSIIKLIESPISQFAYKSLKPLKLCKRLRDFDETFTAPAAGFESALDYYTKSSSKTLVANINIPCQILFAKDDPLIDHTILDSVNLPKNIHVFKTSHGGHMGFLKMGFSKELFWMDDMIIYWIKEHLNVS